MKQIIRIASKYCKETKKVIPSSYELRENEKLFSGRLIISKKKEIDGEIKWLNSYKPFIAFKNDLDLESKNCLNDHQGNLLEIEGILEPDIYKNNQFDRFIITSFRKFQFKKREDKIESLDNFKDEDEIPF